MARNLKHWKVRFTRRGMEPPMPFGKTTAVVCAESREAAREMVPASANYPITASATTDPVTFTYHCHHKTEETPSPVSHSTRKTNAELDREINKSLEKAGVGKYMLVDNRTGKDMRPALDFEVRELLGKKYGTLELGASGPGSSGKSQIYEVRLRETHPYQPTRADRRDPTLPKDETFAVKDRHGTILGTSKSIEGAMAKAPADKSYAIVRGEYVSTGAHFGLGKGRQVAVRENGRWQRG